MKGGRKRRTPRWRRVVKRNVRYRGTPMVGSNQVAKIMVPRFRKRF